MGIDVYLRWENQTQAEKDAQLTGFSITHGHVGYLREAYHGGPYATEVLLPEAFERGTDPEWDGYVRIPAATLRERLPAVLDAARERSATIYNEPIADDDDPILKSYRNFVALVERLESEGKNPRILVSA